MQDIDDEIIEALKQSAIRALLASPTRTLTYSHLQQAIRRTYPAASPRAIAAALGALVSESRVVGGEYSLPYGRRTIDERAVSEWQANRMFSEARR
ncbi:hypothetical protein [Rhodococcus sp. T7]|uniref:hypothetical protein n=1 Tax=Rhodococcus sp. T7 TaxID=627444 RepID=UPI0013572A32|nr:hypothetical protein [Rhodococcus sp. T7]